MCVPATTARAALIVSPLSVSAPITRPRSTSSRSTAAPVITCPPCASIIFCSACVSIPDPPRGRFMPLTWYIGCHSANGADSGSPGGGPDCAAIQPISAGT